MSLHDVSDNLMDPVLTTPAAGNLLTYDGVKNFVNAAPLELAYLPAGTLAVTMPRYLAVANYAVLTSQRLHMQAIALPKGLTITSITWVSATTALGTGVNQLSGIYDSAGTPALLRGSTDATNTAWAANSAKTFTLTATYTTLTAGLFYLGLLINATTVPTLVGQTGAMPTGIANMSPALIGFCNTGVTALPNPASAINVGNDPTFAYIS